MFTSQLPSIARSIAALLWMTAFSTALPSPATAGLSAHRSMALQTGVGVYELADGKLVHVFEIGPRLGHVFVFDRDERVMMNFDILTPRILASKRVHGARCALETALSFKAGPLYPGFRVGLGVTIAEVDGLEDKFAIHETLSIGLGLTLPVLEWLHLSLRLDLVGTFDVLTGNRSLHNVKALAFETVVVLPR